MTKEVNFPAIPASTIKNEYFFQPMWPPCIFILFCRDKRITTLFDYKFICNSYYHGREALVSRETQLGLMDWIRYHFWLRRVFTLLIFARGNLPGYRDTKAFLSGTPGSARNRAEPQLGTKMTLSTHSIKNNPK